MKKPTDKHKAEHILPYNKVVTSISTKPEVDALLGALKDVGFIDEQIYFHHGESGRQNIDLDGSQHGLLWQIIRTYQKLAGPEARMFEMAKKGLEAGHFLVGVQTNGHEEEWEQVGEIMKEHTDQSIFFCGKFTIRVIRY